MSVDVYGFCDANCRHKVLTVDQTVALIQEMAANGFQVPEGFIPQTAVNSIIEQNSGKAICLFVGTQAEYDAWTGDKSHCFSIISDDPTLKNILNKLDEHTASIKAVDKRVDDLHTDFRDDAATTFGDYIIPKKKLIYVSSDYSKTYQTTENLENRLFEIEVGLKQGESVGGIKRVLFNTNHSFIQTSSNYTSLKELALVTGTNADKTIHYYDIMFGWNADKSTYYFMVRLFRMDEAGESTEITPFISKIYEVIE